MSRAKSRARRSLEDLPKKELSEYLVTFDQRTKCEEALWELKRGVATLDILWDAPESGACFDGKTAANALVFINKGLRREIDALECALGFKDRLEGGADV